MIGNLGIQYEVLNNVYWTGNWNVMAYHSPINDFEQSSKNGENTFTALQARFCMNLH